MNTANTTQPNSFQTRQSQPGLLGLLCLLIFTAIASAANAETDTMVALEDKNGRTIKAQVIELTRTDVSVKTSADKTFRIPLTRLSAASLERLKKFKPVEKNASPSEQAKPKPVQLDNKEGKSIRAHILSLSEDDVTIMKARDKVFTIRLDTLTDATVSRLRAIEKIPTIQSSSIALPYRIWRNDRGVVKRKAGGQMTIVPVNFVCKGVPREIGTSFQIITREGKDYIGRAMKSYGKHFPKTAKGKVAIMHMDFYRQYSGSGVAQVWLIDAKTGEPVSNKLTIRVRLD